MAKYIDLAVTGTGHAGTTADPFSWEDLRAIVASGTDTDYYIKGSISTANLLTPWASNHDSFKFLPWGTDPFRINFLGSQYCKFYGTWHNAIIKFDQDVNNIIYPNTSFYNCFYANPLGNDGLDGTVRFYGCTIITLAFTSYYHSHFNAYLQDCIYTGTVYSFMGTGQSILNLTNCVCTHSKYSFTHTFGNPVALVDTNCQFDWTAPAWPAWNAPKEGYNKNMLLANINASVIIGKPPYTGYATDMWGSPRDAIGAYCLLLTILDKIEKRIEILVAGMRKADGYNFDWGMVNEQDESMPDSSGNVTFPRCVIDPTDNVADKENNQDSLAGIGSQDYTNEVIFTLLVKGELPNFETNPLFAARSMLRQALDDLKMLFGIHLNLDGNCDNIMYTGSQIESLINNNVQRPAQLRTSWKVVYSQSRQAPTLYASS
jgi:hypothetical protein